MFRKKTKIVATLGPACSDKTTLLQMIREGVNVFRVNFSHALQENVRQVVNTIREINKEEGYNIPILGDLQGPKLRIGEVKKGVKLKLGDEITFTNQECIGDENKVYITYTNFYKDVKVGERILLDDGKLIMKVLQIYDTGEVKAKVIEGGEFNSKKGVNLPNTKVSLPALTPKDIEDTKLAVSLDFDWLALSFVRNSKDIQDLKDLMPKDKQIPIVSKIEKPEALENIDEILNVTNAVMVARGDLGVEIPAEEVPLIQKKLILKCKQKAKPVIVATQMMETMINNITPTRAEVNDVANSVMDGADAVMLSGETSVGNHPIAVVKQMTKIIQSVEGSDDILKKQKKVLDQSDPRYITDMVCNEASRVARESNCEAIITFTKSGYTAFQISSYRPSCNILVFTANPRIKSSLNLLWGVRCFSYGGVKNTDNAIEFVKKFCLDNKILKENDLTVSIFTMPVVRKGDVNTIRFTRIK